MFAQLNRVVVALALVLFSYAQYQGWNPFDNDAHGGNGGHGSSGSSRTYHK